MASASQALLFSVSLFLVIIYETQAQDALLGDQCSVDRNCISPLTVCTSGICTCFRGHIASEDRRNCIATTTGLCFVESDCRSLQSSRCFIVEGMDGTCTCNEGFSASTDTTRCLSDSNWRGPCEERGQCLMRLGNFAQCLEGRCDCIPQHHFSTQDGQCIRSVGLGDNCENNWQCVADGSQSNVVCVNNRCACASGFVQHQGRCTDGAHSVTVSGAVFLLYWIIKVIT